MSAVLEAEPVDPTSLEEIIQSIPAYSGEMSFGVDIDAAHALMFAADADEQSCRKALLDWVARY